MNFPSFLPHNLSIYKGEGEESCFFNKNNENFIFLLFL